MSETLSNRAGLLLVLGLAGVALGVAIVDASILLAWSAKEGAIEVVSQVVLLAAVLGWLRIGVRGGPGAIGVAVAAAVVLAEEVDWAGRAGLGVDNLHNAWSGASYIVFALPWILLYGAAAWRPSRAAWLPPRLDALAFACIAVLAVGSTFAPAVWEQAIDELSESMLYGLLLVGSLRSGRDVKTCRR